MTTPSLPLIKLIGNLRIRNVLLVLLVKILPDISRLCIVRVEHVKLSQYFRVEDRRREVMVMIELALGKLVMCLTSLFREFHMKGAFSRALLVTFHALVGRFPLLAPITV